MPNSFSKLYVHHVSAVKYRQSIIRPEIQSRIYSYIIGIIKELNQTPIQVNGMADHIHIAARLRPNMAPSEFVQKVKANSSKLINKGGLLTEKFAWQTGGATFSISETHVDALVNYIKNQKEHHKMISFKEEFVILLNSNGINPNSDYMPEFFDGLY